MPCSPFAPRVAAGWLLGLGERTPHRLLLDQTTAEIIHVGTQAILMQRSANSSGFTGTHAAATSASISPPQMPFRLTREMVDALGPAGVDGPFRSAAEITLRIAQTEASSAALLTLLEVFVDEPMCYWHAASVAPMPWAGGAVQGAQLTSRLDAEVAVLHAQGRLLAVKAGTAHTSTTLDVESRIRQLISQATDDDLLASQSPDWHAWL